MSRWFELDVDNWRIPDEHECYSWSINHQKSCQEPSFRSDGLNKKLQDGVRRFILEAALECSWYREHENNPDELLGLLARLDSLNAEIEVLSSNLAELFRERENLLNRGIVDDIDCGIPYSAPDPFDFFDALEGSMRSVHSLDLSCTASEFIAAANREQRAPRPNWPDVLDQVAMRIPRKAVPVDVGDVTIAAIKTKRTDAASWAYRLLARLGRSNGSYPPGFVLGCLTFKQLSVLAEVAGDVEQGAINESQIAYLAKKFPREKHKGRIRVRDKA